MSFENPETWWLAARAAVIIAAFLAFARALLAMRRDSALNFAQLAAQSAALNAQALAEIHQLSEKLAVLNEQVRELTLPSPVASHRLQAVEPAAAPAHPAATVTPPVRGYEMAIRMARGGASIEEIVTSCGTTRAEARLLRRLHCASGANAA
jgi:hypothetical protein